MPLFNSKEIADLRELLAKVQKEQDQLVHENMLLQFKTQDHEALKSLIHFAQENGILKFKYRDFEFDLSKPNPNQSELEALKADYEKTKEIVNRLSLKLTFSSPIQNFKPLTGT